MAQIAHSHRRKYILVTGGSGGIGSAVSKQLSDHGFVPIIGFNTGETHARTLANEISGLAVQLDMSTHNSIVNAVHEIARIIDSESELSGVILGASPAPDLQPFTRLTSQQLLNQLQVNVIGSHTLLSLLINQFFKKQKSGTIVGILSKAIGEADQLPTAGMAGYVIAKSALKSMLLACSAEYSWLRIRLVAPSYTRTRMLNVFDPRYLELAEKEKKFSTAEDVARQIMHEIVS